MPLKLTLIAAAAALVFTGMTIHATAYAQQAAVQGAAPAAAVRDTSASETTVVEVTGIRASKQKSLERKSNAEGVTEVISAEDVGKMPGQVVVYKSAQADQLEERRQHLWRHAASVRPEA